MEFHASKFYENRACHFGPARGAQPKFVRGGHEINWVSTLKYIGIYLDCSTKNLFSPHYSKKVIKAHSVTHAVLHVESMIGTLPPWEGRILYIGWIDPHLVHGCECLLDTTPFLLMEQEKVQCSIIRQLLSVNSRSMIALLFTETGLQPLQVHRLILTLHYLQYPFKYPSHTHAYHALQDSTSLVQSGSKCWYSELTESVASFGDSSLTLLLLNTSNDDTGINALIKSVWKLSNTMLNLELQTLLKAYLL